jgi:hypothetical protein
MKQKLAAAAAAAKPVVQKLAVTTAEGAKKGIEIGKAKAEEMTSSVATAEKRAALMVDTKVRAATLVAAGQQQVVRGQALLAKTPGVGQGAIAERLGIEYESAVEGESVFGYDAELVKVLRQFDQSTAVLRSLVQSTDDTGQAFAALAVSQTLIETTSAAEHTRLEAVPLDHITRSKPSRSLRPDAEKVAAEEARYSLLVGELGKAYGALSAASTQLVEGVTAMRQRATVIAEKVVADVLLTIASHGRWVQDHHALQTQLEGLQAAGKDVTHAEARAAEVASKVTREREGVVLKVKLLEDKRREMMKRWLLDYMGMQSRFYSSGALCFPPRPDFAQPPGTAPSHEASIAAQTASVESLNERPRLPGGYPSPDKAQPQSPPPPVTDYSQYYSSSAADMVEQTEQATVGAAAPPEATNSPELADIPTLQRDTEQKLRVDDENDLASHQHGSSDEQVQEQTQEDVRSSTPPRPDRPNNPTRSQREADVLQDTASGDAVFADAEVRLCTHRSIARWYWTRFFTPHVCGTQQALAQRSEWDLCVHTVVRALNIGCSDMPQAHFLHGIALVCLATY